MPGIALKIDLNELYALVNKALEELRNWQNQG